jgi:glycosyltransferase involved in cell wall biosynthesis
MRVAITHHLPLGGGAVRVIAEYVKRSAHEFTVYSRKEDRPGLVAFPERIEVRRLAPLVLDGYADRIRTLWSLPAKGAELAAAIDAGGHDVVFAHTSDFVQAPETLPYLRTPSLYYAAEPMRSLTEPEPEFGRDERLPARLTRWGINPYERKRKAINDRNILGADQVVTHSRFTADALERLHGVDAEVVPLGVDSDTFAPDGSEREGFVLTVGALHPLKGHQEVIEAVGTLGASAPEVVLVGDRGHLEGPLKALAEERGVRLRLLQELPFAELLSLYRRAGVVACGQIREPFGLIPLEAMASEAPVVAVREGGFRETIRDGETGLLVDRDPHAFGQAIASVLRDTGLARRLGRAGREDVRAHWTWERTAERYDELLERLARR